MIDLSLVTFNSSKWLSSFFLSLESQDFSLDEINLAVCDNSSQDLTFQLLKEYQEKSLNLFASIQIFKRPNRGFGSGHNFNFTKTNSPFILVTNVDLEFEKSSIQKIVSLAAQDGQEYASWEFRQKPFEHPKYYNPITLETSWSSHACVLLQREAIEKVGGYEEKIFMYGEDVELSYRLRAHGYKLRYCPGCVCWHYSYQYANQIKSLQFFGSTLANSYIRIRYGTLRHILAIPQMYLALFKGQQAFPRYRLQIIVNFLKILFNFIYFVQTRPHIQNPTQFPIRGWDYEMVREGAFYEFKPYDESPDSLPLVSVITRSYSGRLPYLKECLQSIENQTYPNIESIVVEDGSETSKHYVESLINSSPHVTYKYFSVPKKGRSHAGNFGLSQATGQFLVFLDDDDLFFADHLEVLVYELIHHPQYPAVYSIAWEVSTEVISSDPLSYIEKSHNVAHNQVFSKAILWHHNFIPIQTILFHRSLYDYNGGFDENLEYLEDWDLWIRYSASNNFLLIEKLTSLYRVPWHRQIHLDREKNMLQAYKLVVQKQSLIKLETTAHEIISLAYAFQVLQQTDIHYYLKCLDTSDILHKTINDTNFMICEYLRQPLTSRYKLLSIIKQKYPASWESLRHFLHTIKLIN